MLRRSGPEGASMIVFRQDTNTTAGKTTKTHFQISQELSELSKMLKLFNFFQNCQFSLKKNVKIVNNKKWVASRSCMSKSKDHSVTQWWGHLLSCSRQLKSDDKIARDRPGMGVNNIWAPPYSNSIVHSLTPYRHSLLSAEWHLKVSWETGWEGKVLSTRWKPTTSKNWREEWK